MAEFNEADTASLPQIETRTDLMKILRLKVYREKGCPFDLLVRLGLPMPEAAVVELTRKGYELGNRRRKRRQLSMFDPPKAA